MDVLSKVKANDEKILLPKDKTMEVLLNGLNISAKGKLQSLCCMMEKNDITSMSHFVC